MAKKKVRMKERKCGTRQLRNTNITIHSTLEVHGVHNNKNRCRSLKYQLMDVWMDEMSNEKIPLRISTFDYLLSRLRFSLNSVACDREKCVIVVNCWPNQSYWAYLWRQAQALALVSDTATATTTTNQLHIPMRNNHR